MRKTSTDPIISEVWAIRDAHAARFGHDMAAIFQDIRTMQEKSGREYVRLPARPVVTSGAGHDPGSEMIDPR